MKRNRSIITDLVYVYLNENNQYVLSYGIGFEEFVQALYNVMNNLLLLNSSFDESEFNLHTQLEYVPSKRIYRLVKNDKYKYGEFCWLDFEEVQALNEMSGQELAEILYLGHMKTHLKSPFYNRLGNRFVYLARDDGWWNKVYYRNMRDFYRMIGEVIALKACEKKTDKRLLGIRRKQAAVPAINIDVLLNLKQLMKEGLLFSLRDMKKTRSALEIPLWVIGDFDHMDDIFDEYRKVVKTRFDVKLVYDKRIKEWKMFVN